MGIQGLLPFLKKVSRQANVKEFKGCTVAIDSYCWLHRGAFACAEKLAMGEKTDQYVHYCMKYVNSLLAFGLKPIMVFDGCRLPSKRNVEKARRERRETHRKKAAQFLREGKRSEARDCLTKCIDITPHMALELMNACRAKGVDCIVAPYEADAQLAYLNRIGVAQLVITEDSDLVLFGCDCIMFKMDFAGNGVVIEKRRLNEALDMRADLYTFDKFRYMCILSGCDYLPSLPGIGLGKAAKIFQRTRQTDMKTVVRKIPALLNMKSLTVPNEYVEGFERADNTFLYHLVFDPLQRKLLPLTPYPPDVEPEKLDYAGPYMASEKALQIALGNIDINTGAKIAHFVPGHKPRSATGDGVRHVSIWDPSYRPAAGHSNVAVTTGNKPNVSRPNTKNTEVTVKLATFHHSKKRCRQGDEEAEAEDTMDDTSLAAMYGESRSGASSARQPETKRSHMEDDFIEVLHNKSLRQSEKKHSHVEDDFAEILHSKSSYFHEPQPEPVNSPPTNAQINTEKGEEKLVCERRPLTLHHRNKFAVSGRNAERKAWFDLNKCGGQDAFEVKSRFFVSSKPHHKTPFFKQLDTADVSTHDSEDDDSDGDHGNTVSSHHCPPDGGRPQPQKDTRSPFSSFTFSQFRSSQDSTCGSTASSQQSTRFIPVKPTKLACSDETDTLSDTDAFSETGQSLSERNVPEVDNRKGDAFDSELSVSQRTSLYSIDTDDVEFSLLETDVSSQKSVDSPSLLSVSRSFSRTESQPRSLQDKARKCPSVSSFFTSEKQGRFSYTPGRTNEKCHSAADLSAFASSQSSSNSQRSAVNGRLSKSPSTVPTTPLTKPGLKVLGKCRASGLSRSGVGARKQKENTAKGTSSQLTMKNFLGQFKLEKREKLQPSTERPPLSLSPNKDNIVDSMSGLTPETEPLFKTDSNLVHRKLAL